MVTFVGRVLPRGTCEEAPHTPYMPDAGGGGGVLGPADLGRDDLPLTDARRRAWRSLRRASRLVTAG